MHSPLEPAAPVPFTQMREDDLLWIDRFAQTLRRSDRRFAQDDAGDDAVAAARAALENPDMHSLEPEVAAAHWVATGAERGTRVPAGAAKEPRGESALASAGRAVSETVLGSEPDESIQRRR